MMKPLTETLQQIRAHASQSLNRLIERASGAGGLAAEFQEAHEALEALPLTTAQFATARNRLESARSYLDTGERGAALYELRLLRRSLAQ